jgi:hypothetical protein
VPEREIGAGIPRLGQPDFRQLTALAHSIEAGVRVDR